MGVICNVQIEISEWPVQFSSPIPASRRADMGHQQVCLPR